MTELLHTASMYLTIPQSEPAVKLNPSVSNQSTCPRYVMKHDVVETISGICSAEPVMRRLTCHTLMTLLHQWD